MLRIQYVTVSTLLRLGLTDVRALAGADWLHRDHQPNQLVARRQATIPRLVGSHCRQSDLRRTVGVAKLALNLRSLVGARSPTGSSAHPQAPQHIHCPVPLTHLGAITLSGSVISPVAIRMM